MGVGERMTREAVFSSKPASLVMHSSVFSRQLLVPLCLTVETGKKTHILLLLGYPFEAQNNVDDDAVIAVACNNNKRAHGNDSGFLMHKTQETQSRTLRRFAWIR